MSSLLAELSADEEEATPHLAQLRKVYNQGESSHSDISENIILLIVIISSHSCLHNIYMLTALCEVFSVCDWLFQMSNYTGEDESMDKVQSKPSSMKPVQVMDQDRIQVSQLLSTY